MSAALNLDIVSAESALFAGAVKAVFATGVLGELEILPGHAPLMTPLKPGYVRVVVDTPVGERAVAEEEVFYISGGVLEVQPAVVTILADTAVRAAELDEVQALEAREKAEHALADQHAEFDHSAALAELAVAAAQLQAIRQYKRRRKLS